MESRYKLVTVRKCSHVWEAEILCERLRSGGLQAFVQGGESNLSLSYAAVALGGVRLQVSADDLERARQILTDDQLQRNSAGRWRCPRCGEPNEASFDLCYSCSLPRPDRVLQEGEHAPPRVADAPPDAVQDVALEQPRLRFTGAWVLVVDVVVILSIVAGVVLWFF